MVVRAFSLIEVMVASALLSAFSSASSLGMHQERVTVGMHLAESRMEELLLLYPDNDALKEVVQAPLVFTRSGALVPTGGTGVNGIYYTVAWTVGAGPIPRTRRIDVTVTWTEPSGPQRVVFTSHRS